MRYYMSKHLGIRISENLLEALKSLAQENKITVSDLARKVLEDSVMYKSILPSEQNYWKINVWRIFDITADQFEHYMRLSSSPEEFFFMIASKSDIGVQKLSDQDKIYLYFTIDEIMYPCQTPRTLSKIEMIKVIITSLNKQIEEKLMEDL